MHMLLASPDVVAADAVASACMGIEDVLDVSTTRLAQYAGLGTADLRNVDLRGAPVATVQRKFVLPRPTVNLSIATWSGHTGMSTRSLVAHAPCVG